MGQKLSGSLHEDLITLHCCRRTLNCHKSAVSDGSCVGVFRVPEEKCKGEANASCCYVLRTLRNVLFLYVTSFLRTGHVFSLGAFTFKCAVDQWVVKKKNIFRMPIEMHFAGS